MEKKFYNFEKSTNTNAFCYFFSQEIEAGDTIYIKLPAVSPNKRGINDIGWLSDGDVTLFGTLSTSKNIINGTALWQEIRENDEINKTVSYIKATNNDVCARRIEIRAIFC